MGTLRGAERRLAALEQGLLCAMLLVMTGLAFAQVALRGLFSAGLLWADTFLRHLVLWVGFLGAALAAADDKQFCMDAAARLMPARVKAGVHLVLHLSTAAVSVLLAGGAWRFLSEERAHAGVLFSVGALSVPTWWFELILPAGFGLLALHYLLKAGLCAGELGGEA